MAIIWSKIPATIKWILLSVLVALISFFVGKYATSDKKVVETNTQTVHQHQTQASTQSVQENSQENSKEKIVYKDRVITQYVNQDTLHQDRDTDCTENFDPSTGKIVTRHCVTKNHTVNDNSSQSVVSDNHNSNSSISQTNNTHNLSTGSSTSTNDVVASSTSSNVTTSGSGGHVWSKYYLKLNYSLYQEIPNFKSSGTFWGGMVGHELIGPFGLSLGGYSLYGGTVAASLDSFWGDWRLSLDAMEPFKDLTSSPLGSILYGVQINRKVIGPVWVGLFGLNNKTIGVNIGIYFKD